MQNEKLVSINGGEKTCHKISFNCQENENECASELQGYLGNLVPYFYVKKQVLVHEFSLTSSFI